ncbi:MAG: iron uptake transporter deferrochelatase/peroxidase subunit [Aeromicrobium sp.]
MPNDTVSSDAASDHAGLSRRKLIGAASVGALALGGIGAAQAASNNSGHEGANPSSVPVPFEGAHQAGIVTPAQDRLHLAVFDVTTESRDDVISLLKDWTAAARKATQGNDIGTFGAVSGAPAAPPEDTGEALGLPPSQLTLTIGFGPSFFEKNGKARFGLDGKKPDLLKTLPKFAGDQLRPEISDGDIVIQACANDPQVAVHAIRNLARIAFGRASVRYSQLGFGRTSSTSTSQSTARNLLGYKDGTANIKVEEKKDVNNFVWVHEGDGPEWLTGGSYLVTRKINMRIEIWDREPLEGQNTIIGRTKGSGGPMSGGDEFDKIDFKAEGTDGRPLVDHHSHVRLAHPDFNKGAKLLRRGYNFVDGSDGLGQLSAGLFFIAYQRDPIKQFAQVQQSLAGPTRDLLNEYIVHVSSGLFACPPGVGKTGFWGEGLFA